MEGRKRNELDLTNVGYPIDVALRPGDVIVLRSKSKVGQRIQKLDGPWAHSGMILGHRDDDHLQCPVCDSGSCRLVSDIIERDRLAEEGQHPDIIVAHQSKDGLVLNTFEKLIVPYLAVGVIRFTGDDSEGNSQEQRTAAAAEVFEHIAINSSNGDAHDLGVTDRYPDEQLVVNGLMAIRRNGRDTRRDWLSKVTPDEVALSFANKSVNEANEDESWAQIVAQLNQRIPKPSEGDFSEIAEATCSAFLFRSLWRHGIMIRPRFARNLREKSGRVFEGSDTEATYDDAPLVFGDTRPGFRIRISSLGRAAETFVIGAHVDEFVGPNDLWHADGAARWIAGGAGQLEQLRSEIEFVDPTWFEDRDSW